MPKKPKIEIRNDDVLLVKDLTKPMKRALVYKSSFFDWFKETDQFYEKNNIPQILAILADGIEVYPEWVKYIKSRQHRFFIEMHGHTHLDFQNLSAKEGYEKLSEAKSKIENTFGVEVTRWYVPFGRARFPKWGEEVCSKMGIILNRSLFKLPHFPFHYWNPKSVERIKKIVENVYGI